MCTVLLPPGDNPIAVNKYITYHIIRESEQQLTLGNAYVGKRNFHTPYLQHCKICLLSECYFLGITRVSIVTVFVQPAFQDLDGVFWEVTATLPHSVAPSWMAVTSRLVWPSSGSTHLVLDFRTRVLLICAAGWYKSFPCCNRNQNTTLNDVNEAQAATFTVIKLQGVSASRTTLMAGFDPNEETRMHLRWF